MTYTRARVNYCAHLGKNVVFACINEAENNWECMNKQDCNFEALGCRNKLVVKTDEIKKVGLWMNGKIPPEYFKEDTAKIIVN